MICRIVCLSETDAVIAAVLLIVTISAVSARVVFGVWFWRDEA